MDRQRVSALAHQDRPIAGPLSDASVAELLDHALVCGDERVLDLGCGEGAWLLRAAEGRPGVRGVGVDRAPEAIGTGRAALARAGLEDRVELREQDAREFSDPDPFDVVLCVGATHAFGGLKATLEAARGHLAPGVPAGCVLVGEAFWEREPGPETLDELGASPSDYDDLATTVDHLTADGWTPVYGHVSSLAEWDAYEWSWTGSLSRWALDHPDDPDSTAALAAATAHRDGWLHGYRRTLGFVTLLLRPTPGPEA